MRYLHLRFTDAGLFIKNNDDYYLNCENDCIHYVRISPYTVDIKDPIGVNQISNMLHAMMGMAPIPSKRNNALTYFKKDFQNKEIFNLAKNNSYIKYSTSYKYDNEKSREENMAYLRKFSFFTQTAKPSNNSGIKNVMYIGDTKINGNYNWDYLFRRFRTKEEHVFLEKMLILFNEVTENKNVMKEYNSFIDFVIEFREHYNDEKVKNFLNENKAYISKDKVHLLGTPFLILLFKRIIKNNEYVFSDIKQDSNITYSSLTPVLYSKGTNSSKVNFSGEIIIEIENESLIERLHEFGSIPTILDGGLIEVLGCKKIAPSPDWKENFDKISDENLSESTDIQ